MLVIKDDCTACGACARVCPPKCISFCNNKDGFELPVVDKTKCIDCGRCEKVCHLNIKKEQYPNIQKAFAAINNDNSILRRSTSGGVFTAIATYVLKNNGVVYGCAYCDGLIAKHVRVDSPENLKKLNGSKYVQSNTLDIYDQVKRDLEVGIIVLFSGTPCQVAGLYAFNQKKYDNLITVDIVCHGVTSHKFFSDYIQWYEEKHNCYLTDYNFRSKLNSGWSYAGTCKGISKKDKSEYKEKIFYYKEYYYYYFLSGDLFRQSCYSCKYANLNRPGDFTLGDLWGAEGLKLPFSIRNGCSLVICNSEKAINIFTSLKLEFSEVSLVDVAKNNRQLRNPSVHSNKRKKLLYRINHAPQNIVYSMFIKENYINLLKIRLKYMLPTDIKRILLKLRYR